MGEDIVKEKKERSMLVPFLVGGIVGAGLAFLLAPKAGQELRKDILDLATDTREKIASTIGKGKNLYEGSKSAVKSAIDAGKTAYIEERDKMSHVA
jgi:gas vesicle protein